MLLLVAYAGNPQAAFAKVVNYFGGSSGSSQAPAETGAAAPDYTIPQKVQKKVANHSAPVTPGITATGAPDVQVPVQDLSTWGQFVHFLTSNDPFYHAGVVK